MANHLVHIIAGHIVSPTFGSPTFGRRGPRFGDVYRDTRDGETVMVLLASAWSTMSSIVLSAGRTYDYKVGDIVYGDNYAEPRWELVEATGDDDAAR